MVDEVAEDGTIYFEQKNINQAVKYLSVTYVKMMFICNFSLRYNTVELYSEDVPL